MVPLEVSDSEMTITTGSEESCLAESWNTRRIEMLFPEVLKGLRPENDICVAADPFTPLKSLNTTSFELNANAEGKGSSFLNFLTFMRLWTLHGICVSLGLINGVLYNVAPAWARKAVHAGRKIVSDILRFEAGPQEEGAVGRIGRDFGWDILLPIVFVLFGIFLEFMIRVTPLGETTYSLGYSLASGTIRAAVVAVIERMQELEQNDDNNIL